MVREPSPSIRKTVRYFSNYNVTDLLVTANTIVLKFLVIHQCLVLLACTLWGEDLKTAQYAQLEVHALTLLVHLWLVLEVNIPLIITV